ncbi:MAG: VTT domain-containing protein [Brachybacterium sp.]|nr:VTT domain-containing protein [Brachybacterium sp.]
MTGIAQVAASRPRLRPADPRPLTLPSARPMARPAREHPVAAGPRGGSRWQVLARYAPLIGLAVCATMVVIGLQTGVLQSQANLREFITTLGIWGPLVFMAVGCASVVFPIVPGGLLVLAAPVLFGPVAGTIYAYLYACTGLFVNFAIGRHVGLDLIHRMFSARTVEKYLGWTRSPRFTRGFAAAIALPIAPDDLLCYLAGTTRMRWRTYALIIILGKPWSLILYGLGVGAVLHTLIPW